MQHFDLLVAGGGIHGAAVARDAAGRGRTVLLVEQGDLAQGTSSASTKLIHGGLRYLEMYDFGLVRAALTERETMLRTAPHLVHPMRFLLPHAHAVRPWWVVRVGLWLYDLMARGSRLPRSRGIALGPPLKTGIRRGFAYWDAWVDDARLVVLNARDAADHGAMIRTRTRLAAAAREGGRWLANIEDVQTGALEGVSAGAIVNATGAQVIETLAALGLAPRTAVRLVKGSHIIVPRLFDGDEAWLLQQPDRRIVFAIPYEGAFTLIGTTDVPWSDRAQPPAIEAAEIAYLCDAANRYFARQIEPEDVVASYAGVRALHEDGAAEARAVTREHVLEIDASAAPVVSVIGGKITTARAVAEEIVDRLAPGTPRWTSQHPLPGGGGAVFPDCVAEAEARWPWLGHDRALRLARSYGTLLPRILAGEDRRALPGGLLHAELAWMVSHEWAMTWEDILTRRSKIGLHLSPAERTALPVDPRTLLHDGR